ncbi:putative C-type lectin domain family 20 member A [Amia ocellicauda]|uniref:putative C-type lectin domain family 20 member A n=1 Tax=Amia ocellicauda TaxID=2972642 RepID=UPI00346448F2
MDQCVLLFLLFTGLREGATSYYRKFHLVTSMATWSEAQQYCREKYSDLATANSLEEAVEVSEMAAANQYTWIGLHRGNWKWSNGNPMTFNKLTIVEAREPPCCGLVSSDGTWGKTSCLEQHSFLCYEETSEGLKKYIVVQQVKSWTEAQRYCRERHTDLVSVTSATEDQDVKIKAQGTVVWIGLFFEPWTWSDGAKFSLDYFNNIESYSLSEECACVSVYYSCGTRKWNDFSCNVKMPFICYEGKERLVQTVTFTVDSKIDPNNPEMRENVLRQARGRFSQLGLTGEVQLWWRERQDGQVFHQEMEEPDKGEIISVAPVDPELKSDISLHSQAVWEGPGRDRLVQRVTLRLDPIINPNHPEMREYVLRQVRERFSQLGLTVEVQLWWRERLDGQVFHQETKEQAKVGLQADDQGGQMALSIMVYPGIEKHDNATVTTTDSRK